MDVYREYQAKLRSPEQAVQIVKDGDWVDYSHCCSFPAALDKALAGRRDELKNVNVRGSVTCRPVQVLEQDPDNEVFSYNVWHCSAIDRKYLDQGRAYHQPMLFRNCGSYYERGFAPVDVAMITVAPMDRQGNFSFGLTNCCQQEVLDAADHIILEVNRDMPVVYGVANDHIHISDVDWVVESDEPISAAPGRPASELDKKIAKIMRKLARKVASDEPIPTSIKPEDLYEYLGAVEYSRDKYQGNGYAGVVTGLAWTAVGGEILFVESSLSKGKGSKLTLTGNLGDVMKESAMLALEYIHAHAAQFNINEELFENWNVHVHVPEGAIPKDGPSAGITMVTSLVSAFTQRKVKKNLAMTGEITLRGKVLPVGGIKEKILAAKRAGIKELILCKENEKDINEIKPEYLKGLVFHYVSDIQQVVDLALLREKVDNPLF